RVRVIESAKSRPVDGAKTHRTRLATGVDLAIRETESAEFRAGAPDGGDFGVGSRVAGRGDLVPAFRHDDTVAHDHGSKRPTPVGAHAFQRKLDGALHEIFIGHTVLTGELLLAGFYRGRRRGQLIPSKLVPSKRTRCGILPVSLIQPGP